MAQTTLTTQQHREIAQATLTIQQCKGAQAIPNTHRQMLEVLSAEAVEAFLIAVTAAVHIAAAVSAEGAVAVHIAAAVSAEEAAAVHTAAVASAGEAAAVHIAVAVSAEEAVAATVAVQAAVVVDLITVADVDRTRTSAFIMRCTSRIGHWA